MRKLALNDVFLLLSEINQHGNSKDNLQSAMSSGLNILRPSLSSKKCPELSLINRVPETALEQKLFLIRRDHARFKLDCKLRETKLWDELYHNHKELKASFVSK